jgi:hypothetical protein
LRRISRRRRLASRVPSPCCSTGSGSSVYTSRATRSDGWTALELAKLGRARSVCALGPAGLWETGPIKPMFGLAHSYLLARRWWHLAPRVMGTRSLRALFLR